MMGGEFGNEAEALGIFKILVIGLAIGMAMTVGVYIIAIYLIGV